MQGTASIARLGSRSSPAYRRLMNFLSDNTAGASPHVMAALAAANDGPAAGYGADDWTKRVEERLSAIFDREVAAFLVTTGTAANALALASVVRPWGAVITHEESHIVEDECGAPEFFSDGAKLVDLPGPGAKLTPGAVTKALGHLGEGSFHHVQAQALSITQATECGTIYTPAEVRALREASAARRLTFHMDGARFANALVSLGCTPAEITWKAGIDVLSFGGTKNGAWAAEAVVFFDPAKADEMKWRRKRAGQTLSKGRFLGAQFEGLLADDHWLHLARHANAQARLLADAVEAGGKARLAWPSQANEVFIILSAELDRELTGAGVRYYPWSSRSLAPDNALRPDEIVARFVMSFATDPEEVQRLIALVR